MSHTKTHREELTARERIGIWMIRNRVRSIDIARDLDLDRSAVYHFLAGRLVSKRIRDRFEQLGCPAELLDELRRAA